MPAPRQNLNATTHGLTITSEDFFSSDAHAGCGITLKKLPPGCRGIGNKLRRFFKAVERRTLETRGQLGPWEWCRIQAATFGLQRFELAQRWLAEDKGLKLESRIALLREAAAGQEQRDRALRDLGLDRLVGDDDREPDLSGGLFGESTDQGHPQAGSPARVPWACEVASAPDAWPDGPEAVQATLSGSSGQHGDQGGCRLQKPNDAAKGDEVRTVVPIDPAKPAASSEPSDQGDPPDFRDLFGTQEKPPGISSPH